MKENADKYLDDLAKKVIKDASMESPSFSFTDVVMSQVEALNISSVTVYKPLISKKTWVFISIVFLCATAYLILGNSSATYGWLSSIDLSVISNNKLTDSLSGFTMSNTLSYSIGFLALHF